MSCSKNDITDPDVRCRLVGQEVNTHADQSVYATTSPLEANKMLFSQWATKQWRDGKIQRLLVDAKKAYFYGVPTRNLYVEFPAELGMPTDMVGKLVRCVYGNRDAGAIWESCTLIA